MMASKVRPPGLFQIEITNVCNIDCAMCARSAGLKRPIKHMDIELFKTIVDQSAHYQMPVHWFHHFGETLAYPHLREALSYFKLHGYGPGRVSTNAILMNDEKIDILLENASYVLCCLDSMDPKAYFEIRNNLHFDRVKQNIQNLIAERNKRGADTKIVVQFLRTSHNQDEDIAVMMDHFGRHENVTFIEKRTDKHPNGGDMTLSVPFDEAENRRTCTKIAGELCVLVDGGCVPCCWDANGEQIIGTIPDEDIGQIWQGYKHREMQRQLASGKLGDLPLCDKCSGPISETVFGVSERVNAWAKEWAAQGKRVVLAPANPPIYQLLETTLLKGVNTLAIADRAPRSKESPNGLPIVSYDEIPGLEPDLLFIYSPAHSTDIYFDHRHLRERGIEVVALGNMID